MTYKYNPFWQQRIRETKRKAQSEDWAFLHMCGINAGCDAGASYTPT